VCLIYHEVAPVELLEHRFLLDHHLVGRDTDVPLTRQNHVTDQRSLYTHNIHVYLNGNNNNNDNKLTFKGTHR